MRYMVPPLTPFPSVKSTGAVTAVADGLALGETDARVVGEGWMDTAAVAAVELTLWLPVSQPPSYKTAARRTQAAAPRPTAIRIAVSGLRGGAAVAGSLSRSKRRAGCWSKTTLLATGTFECSGAGSGSRSQSSGAAAGSTWTGSGSRAQSGTGRWESTWTSRNDPRSTSGTGGSIDSPPAGSAMGSGSREATGSTASAGFTGSISSGDPALVGESRFPVGACGGRGGRG